MSQFRVFTLIYLLFLSMFSVVIGLAPLIKTGGGLFIVYGLLIFGTQVMFLLEKPISIVLIKRLSIGLVISLLMFAGSLVLKFKLQPELFSESQFFSDLVICGIFGLCLVPVLLIKKYLSA